MKLVITGGQGNLASTFNLIKGNEHEVFLPTHKDLDITIPDTIREFLKNNKIEHVIHAAAITNLEYCEENPEQAFLVNSLGSKHIAQLTAELNIPVTYISTEAVFSGNATVPYSEASLQMQPRNVYGWSKLVGEWWTSKFNSNSRIIRLGWLYGPDIHKDKKFVTAISKLLIKKADISVINDIYGSPTYVMDAAMEILKIIENDEKGLFHIANHGGTSRYKLAVKMKSILNSTSLITPVSESEYPSTLDRAKYSILKTNRAEHTLRNWEDALEEYLNLQRENLKNEI